jgi:putative transposase
MLVSSPLLHYQMELMFQILDSTFRKKKHWLKQIDDSQIICFENLNITNMSKNHNLAKYILDAAWSKLVTSTSYKAENAGRKVILVDSKNTSKTCSNCGMLVDKELSERIHNCPFCGLSIDRDLNASINILRLGLQSVRKIDRYPSLQ